MIAVKNVFAMLFLLELCVAAGFCAEVFVIQGIVIDGESGQPVSGVSILSDKGSKTATGKDGRFEIEMSPGAVALSFRKDGYMELSDRFAGFSGERVQVKIVLNRLTTYQDTVVVESAPFPEMEPVQNITPEYVVKAPGAFEDALQSLQVMPGVIGGDDYSARLYVRGGRPDQNGIYMDGVPIYDPYRLFGLTSLFNPETIDTVRLYPGGFDVRYGDRLSAVIEVENRRGSFEKSFQGSLNVSLTNANLITEGKLFDGFPSSWLISARRTYYDLVLKQTGESDSSYPSFTDVQGLFYFQPHRDHQWFVTLLRSDEGSDLVEEDDTAPGDNPDHIDLLDDQKNTVAGINGSHIITGRMRLSYLLSFTQNEQTSDIGFIEGETAYQTQFDQTLTGSNTMLKTMFEWYLESHSLIGGLEIMSSDNEVAFNIDTDDPRVDIPEELFHFKETQDFRKTGAFLQDSWAFLPDWELKAGVRWDSSTLADMSRWSPRVSMRWEADERWTFRAAWGYYYQFPSYESLQGDGYFLDLRGIKDLHLKPEQAIHYMVSSEYKHSSGWELSVDVYYKQLKHLLDSGEETETVLILDDNGQAAWYTRDSMTFIPENSRQGFARGLDLVFKLDDAKERPYYGMLSYTYCEARSRKFGDPYHWESWDRRHSVSWIAGWKLNDRWELGWKWQYGGGFPYTPVTRIIRVVDDQDGDGQYEPENGETFSYQRDDPESAVRSRRLPDYHRLDLRVQYSRTYRHLDVMYYLDIINVYANKNVQYYTYNADYSQRYDEEGMPLIPSFGVKLRF